MSQHSDSPRLEALESSVSEIQETMSELVGMLRQLTTETRTAGDGRRGEESGGARRDAAHIYRGRSLLRRDTESQQFKMKGREKLQRLGISPSTTGLHQNRLTQDQGFQLEWAR